MNRREFARWLAGGIAAAAFSTRARGQKPSRPLRVAISVETLGGANVNDARAAYKVWSQQIASSLGLKAAELVPDVFIPSDQIIRMILKGEVELFGLSAMEFVKVLDFVDKSSVLLEDSASSVQYVVLVHNGSNHQRLADLKGCQIAIHRNRDMNLLPAWIDNLLAAEGLPAMEQFFGDLLTRESVTQVVLPVFFRKVEAAILMRSRFETAVEMNPQLGKDLHAMLVSPNVVPIVLCFHKNCSAADRRMMEDSIFKAESLPAGKQIEALYQSNHLVRRPLSFMDATVELVRQFQRNEARWAGLRKEHS